MLALVATFALLQGSGAEREARVLELVREIARDGTGFLGSAHFARIESEFGAGPFFEARVTLLCGNSDQGSFDDEAARKLVRRLGALYGLRFEPEVVRQIGSARAVLDGFDAARGIGFELRGRRGEGREALDELPENTLDEFERRVLAGQGVRVHVDGARRFRNLDGCEFQGLLAYLAGVVAFLNEVTDGEDVELGGLGFVQEACFTPFELEAGSARLLSPAPEFEGGRSFRLAQRGTLRLPCRGRADLAPGEASVYLTGLTGRSDEERVWRGDRRAGPSSLVLEIYDMALEEGSLPPEWQLTWRQDQDGRALEVRAAPNSRLLFLPSEADPGAPFELELDLGPGQYRIDGARVGVSAVPLKREPR
jgi:hypothetical protein